MGSRLLAFLAVFSLLGAACADDTGSAADPAESTTSTAPNTSTTTSTSVAEPSIDDPETPAKETEPGAYEGYLSETYDDPSVWLCWPGNDDVCARNNDTTIVYADGSIEVEPFVAAEDPAIDCFYVYPTISSDLTVNSDLVPAETEEIYTTWTQASRYQEVCRVFAPMYPQNTLTSMFGRVEPAEGVSPFEVAYAGVLDAWSHYMATANDGRGVLLVGHSQGAGMIANLLAEEIDGNDAMQTQFIGAHVLGSSVPADVGSAYDTIPACVERDQLGCIVSYSSYKANEELTEADFFGSRDGVVSLCTNPAALDGSLATTQPYFLYSEVRGLLGGTLGYIFDPEFDAPEITTDWITYPDLVTTECIDNGTQGYLSVGMLADPDDPRTDDVGGTFTPGWGLHLVDANVVLGDLVDLVAAQVAAYFG